MKNYLIIYALISFFVLSGCKKDLETEKISRITNLPVLTLNGSNPEIIKVGSVYSEAGAVAKEVDATLQVKIEGSVNTSAPGIYVIEYSASNSDGYSATAARVVAVMPATLPAEVLNTDLSGVYERSATKAICFVEKVTDGLYFIDNFGGVAPAPSPFIVPAYIMHTAGTTLLIPKQPSSIGTIEGKNGSITAGGTLNWAVVHSSFGTALRSFSKIQKPSIRYEN